MQYLLVQGKGMSSIKPETLNYVKQDPFHLNKFSPTLLFYQYLFWLGNNQQLIGHWRADLRLKGKCFDVLLVTQRLPVSCKHPWMCLHFLHLQGRASVWLLDNLKQRCYFYAFSVGEWGGQLRVNPNWWLDGWHPVWEKTWRQPGISLHCHTYGGRQDLIRLWCLLVHSDHLTRGRAERGELEAFKVLIVCWVTRWEWTRHYTH